MSNNKRVELVSDPSVVAGFYILMDGGPIRKFLLPRRAKADDADPTSKKFFLTSSNAATSPAFEIVTTACVQSVLCLAKEEDAPPPFKQGKDSIAPTKNGVNIARKKAQIMCLCPFLDVSPSPTAPWGWREK